jgi:hypothetical protein
MQMSKKNSKNYLEFVRKYKDVLIDGDFAVIGGSNADSECRSSLNGLTIVGYYENKHVVEVNNNMILINGSGVDGIYLQTSLDKKLNYQIKDCCGNLVEKGEVEGLKFVFVKAGSMVFFD